ncbi:MAG: carbohydrate ABC transporter permease [Oscillospiraceae bacterium]|nr:carbohydrate ABC transporter permease [Oscillospiraceae bacterium]
MSVSRQSIRKSIDDRIFYCVVYTILTVLTVSLLYPIIYVLSSSLSSGLAVSTGKVVLWPVDFSIEGYRRVFGYTKIWVGYRNTVFYTLAGTLINVLITMFCAYPLARRNLPHRGVITFLFSFTMIFSGGMIPTYLLISSLGMLNTIWAMLIPGALGVYQMIVTRTFIQSTIPLELMEATQIDGCNDFLFFSMFVIPLSKAVIAVIALQYAVGHWNSYFNAYLYLSDQKLYPLQLYLREILVLSQIDVSELVDEDTLVRMQGMAELLKFALIVVATAPIMCLYPFLQKYFVTGIMIGSLKG